MTTDLITRIESAGSEEQRELLEKVWQELHFLGGDTEGEWDSCRLCQRFHKMLDAEAYVDAAMLLVPSGDGLHWLLGLTKSSKGLATIWKNDTPFGEQGEAATPALALLAAILKAGGRDDRT